MIKEKVFKPFYDITRHSDMVVARVFQEERKEVSPEKRIVHADKYFKHQIEKDDWTNNRHSGDEKEATTNIFNLAESGFNLVIWISPESRGVYEEGRLNIAIPGMEGNELFFESWGLPLLVDENETLKLGEKLLDQGGASMDPIYNNESLRRQPIGFELTDGIEWLEKCKELMPEMMWAWRAIETGQVDVNMKKIALLVAKAKQVAGKDNVLFERIMASNGYKLNVSGNHGGSWLSKDLGNGQGIIAVMTADGISYVLGSTEGLNYCQKCGTWHKGDKCPVCD